ncbi:developmental regulator flbA [Nannizzia gypsea CBS 118893]|uniref:Developmental regulator flbA n=1 Tax=Arthroderma gypseum (strain ATCC MYA-4604 / CBS 118893) TaxID=535722 RepID=E4UQF0_ARTGP|nr:developmental regulator flbA [Nannizzia gypsea CBS 118893]EFR00020.1 developmental regulator flbA [Nannizzia gypsea CBS 118893]
MSRPALDRSNSLHQHLKHRPYIPLEDHINNINNNNSNSINHSNSSSNSSSKTSPVLTPSSSSTSTPASTSTGKTFFAHPSRSSRRSLAAIAIQKTSSAFSLGKPASTSASTSTTTDYYHHHHHHHQQQLQLHQQQLLLQQQQAREEEEGDPFRDPDSWESDDRPAAAMAGNQSASKMHQTSSRLLRMTTEERPFTRDFKDLFSTLMVSLKLETHRVRFSKFEHTFTAEEAINNLGSLKFSQSNRMPDPKDPSRIVTTTTTTTFSMAKEMARIPAQGRPLPAHPQGINILHRFCQRNGITARHIMDIIDSPRNTMQLVILERDSISDQISNDKGTIEVIFRRFAGQDGPNIKPTVSSSDSDSLSDYSNGVVGVKMARERKIGDKLYQNTFTGKAAMEWLMDCCTTIDRRETMEIASLFVRFGMITSFLEDKTYMSHDPSASLFQPTKSAIYGITEHGQRICGWIARDRPPNSTNSSSTNSATTASAAAPRDSNNARLHHIIQDPALRLLFREFLRYSLCEENMSFYLDVSDFTANYRRAEKAGAFSKMDTVRETLASAYGLYNAFLCTGFALRVEHRPCSAKIAWPARMTRAVGDDASMVKSLTDVVQLFEAAQLSVFKLMSSDSVPKFARDPKYAARPPRARLRPQPNRQRTIILADPTARTVHEQKYPIIDSDKSLIRSSPLFSSSDASFFLTYIHGHGATLDGTATLHYHLYHPPPYLPTKPKCLFSI